MLLFQEGWFIGLLSGLSNKYLNKQLTQTAAVCILTKVSTENILLLFSLASK